MGKIIDRVRERCKRANELSKQLFEESLRRSWREADRAWRQKIAADVARKLKENELIDKMNAEIISKYTFWENIKFRYKPNPRLISKYIISDYEKSIADYYV